MLMKTTNVKEYDCYLFDADGTLFDTIDMIVRCFGNTASVYGLPRPDRESILRHVGLPLRKQMECYFGGLSDEVFNRYRDTHMAYQLKIYREHLRLFPGVAEALRRLHERGKRCAVVTSRMLSTLSIYLKETEIDGCFSVLVTPESTSRHKPDPQPVLEAIARLGGTADGALVVGDASYDIECGSRAGADTAFVRWSRNPVESLGVTPTYVLSDMRDLCVW
ncbi:MAG: HAD-IA family hydrolase [Chitinispirillaceae bacterium]|nr:HAD-IA family hydrolase [Chitinispirillaceae bacterium]